MQLLMEHNVFSRDMNNKMLGVEIANDNLLTVKSLQTVCILVQESACSALRQLSCNRLLYFSGSQDKHEFYFHFDGHQGSLYWLGRDHICTTEPKATTVLLPKMVANE